MRDILSRRRPTRPLVETVAYIVCVVVLLVPIWVNHTFVTLDGPMHLTNARLLIDHLQPANVPLLDQYFVPNLTLFPYWVEHVALTLLLTVFSPQMAEKIFLSAYVTLFALFLRLVIRELNKEATFLSFLGLLLIGQRPFQMGFLSFCFSQVFLLILVWHWLKHPDKLSPPQILGRTILFLAAYFSHPTTYAFAVVVIGTLTVWAWACDNPVSFPLTRARLPALFDSLAAFAVTVLPSALLLVAYTLTAPSYKIAPWTTYWALLSNFLRQTGLALVSQREASLGIVAALVFLALSAATLVHRIRSRTVALADGFLIAFLLALGVHLYASLNMVGFFERMQTLPLLMLLFWFCGRPWTVPYKRAVPAVTGLALITLLVIRWPIYAQASANVEEVVAVLPAIQDGSTVLPLNYAQYGCARDGKPITDLFYLFLHTPEYLGASDKQLVMLNNIGPLYPMFPYRWRADRDPFRHIQTNEGLEHLPPSVDFASYRQRTGGTVDYVLTWCLDGRYEGHPYVQDVRRQLAQNYEPVATSPHGQVVVYRDVSRGRESQQPVEPTQGQLTSGYYLQSSYDLYKARRFPESIDAAKKALSLDPKLDWAHNNICAAYNELKQWDKAIGACDEALAINPGNQLARNNGEWARQQKSKLP